MEQAQFDDIQWIAQLGCWSWDVRANRVSWTDGLYRIYGLDPATFAATYESYLALVHRDDRQRVAAAIEDAFRHRPDFDFEERIVRPDGAVRWLRSRGRVKRDAEGNAVRLVGVCHDLTDVRSAQEQALRLATEQAARQEAEASATRLRGVVLQLETARRQLSEQMQQLESQAQELEAQAVELEVQSEELQQALHDLEQRNRELQVQREAAEQARTAAETANRAKSAFLASMSHELRTPLNAIAGYTEILRMGLHGPVTPQQVETLDRIQRNERRLLSHVTDILNFTRVSAGRLNIRQESVDVLALMRELESVVAPQAAARQQALLTAVRPGVVALADRERTDQILLNLVGNAVKFTQPGGAVRVSAEAAGDVVRLTVADNGPGIPADSLDAIFDPFVQVDTDLTRQADGVGLGLSISRELARAMGGEISVHSRPGKGSVFTLILPRADGPRPAGVTAPAAATP